MTRDQLANRASLWFIAALVAAALAAKLDEPLVFFPVELWFVMAGLFTRRACVLLTTKPVELPPRPPVEDFGQHES